MFFGRNIISRPRGARAIAFFVAIFALASFGAVQAGVILNAVVHCNLSGACQSYNNMNGLGFVGRSSNTTIADQFHEFGVGAYGNGGNGIYATSVQRNAGFFDGQNTNFYSLFAHSVVSGGFMLGASNDVDGGSLSLDSFGNLTVSGSVTAGAIKVRHSAPGSQDVSGYAAESTGQTLEDVGAGRIVGGRGVVRLDPAFARTIEPNYYVFVTPLGKNHGLYVGAQNGAGFEVRESEGAGTLAFNYRVVGTPIGASHAHLPVVAKLAPPGVAGRVR